MSIDLAKLVYEDHLQHKTLSWPKLELTSGSTTIDQIWTSSPSTQFLAVVIEKEPYSNGYAVYFFLKHKHFIEF